ncbi:MAG: hypothetical protein ACREM6_15480, partial [Vulcanimicrobiaceae bacterium]
GVRSFVARALDAGDLVTDKAAYGAVFAGLPAPRSLPVSFNDATLNDPDVIGGNRVVQVSVAGVGSARTMHLMSGTLPSGFTVVGAPVWHAIVYRRDQSHRFVFGLAGRSHVWINAHVSVSYDNWAHAKQWCDFNLYGNPNGLDPGDVHSKYLPNDLAETAQSIIDRCRNTEGHPTPPPPEAPDEGVYH